MNRQCRYCIYARENEHRYTCDCILKGKETSLYNSCEEFDDDWRNKDAKCNRQYY